MSAFGSSSLDAAAALTNLANADVGLHRFDSAIERHTRVLEIRRRLLPPGHELIGTSLFNLADALMGNERYSEATRLLRQSLANWEKSLGKDHDRLGYALTDLGKCLVALERTDEAIPVLERAVAVRSAPHLDQALRADSKISLARALWLQGRSMKRALELAKDAKATYASIPWREKDCAAAEAWLSRRKPRSES